MYTVTLSATGVTKIATANAGTGPGGWYLVFTGNTNSVGTAWNGSVVLGQDLNAPGSVPQPMVAANLTTVAYYNPSTGATVAAGTAITATGNWQVGLTGFDLYLNHTLTTAGTTVTVSLMPASALTTEPVTGFLTANNPLFGGVLSETAAQATPAALTATTMQSFASTVSGAVLGGFGTTNDVTLMNRAGTAVVGVTANTVNVTMAGALAITGALSGVTTLATSSTINGQTISATASFTGTLKINSAVAGAFSVLSGAGVTAANIQGPAAQIFVDNAGAGNTFMDQATLTIRSFAAATIAVFSASGTAFALTGAATFSSTVTLLGGATFLTTSSALTNGAGASAGTIANAPAVGNPTKWIGINDNGTTRYIPSW